MAGSLPEGMSRPPADLEISSGQVHVWTLNIEGEKRAWERLLSSEEVATAGRLSGPLQQRFRNSRGALRLLLGRYLRLDPASIEFSVGPTGKLFLADGQLGFNLAHSSDMVVIAIGRDCEVGVDVEKLEAPANSAELAARFFSAEEVEVLSGMTQAMYGRTFLTMWVRKEAALKAEGTGIGRGLLLPVPHLSPTHGAEVTLRTGDNKHRSFYLYDINAGSCFVAALAVSCRPGQIVERVIGD